ncbi:hypothetical protein GCM10027403_07800 [Arthrobacter tecti]
MESFPYGLVVFVICLVVGLVFNIRALPGLSGKDTELARGRKLMFMASFFYMAGTLVGISVMFR